MSKTKALLDEAIDKNFKNKKEAIRIFERGSQPNYTKEWILDELFKLYMEMK